MEFTEKQKNYLADVYANGKSSSDVFREQHKADFIAGFEKALSLFAVSSSVCHCDKLPDGEIAISSKALQKPYGDLGQTDC